MKVDYKWQEEQNRIFNCIAGPCIEVTRHQETVKKLEKINRYEKMTGAISRMALRETDTGKFLQESLKILGEGTGVCRSYIFACDEISATMSNTHEWTSLGIQPQIDNLQELPNEDFTWWLNQLKNRKSIKYGDIKDIPDKNSRDTLRMQEIKSVLVLPLFLGKEFYGYIGFDSCLCRRDWEEETVLLNVAAEIISLYLLQKEREAKINYLNYHDPLTGLYNRMFMEEQIKLLDHPGQLPLTVILGDVNGLKLTNDIFGNEEGDRLLQQAAATIRDNCPEEAVLARWGGDEFLIIIPRTGAEGAERIIHSIKSSAYLKSTGRLRLSIALGYAVKDKKEENIKNKLKEAEEWMYQQKFLKGKSYRNAIINAMLATLFEKSNETEEHAQRLKHYCSILGRELHCSSRELEDLAILAMLHDIGKIGIREDILQKPLPLTPDEWQEMHRHPEIGFRIARNIPELCHVSEYILYHHERWDGCGYPRGLAGEEIPLVCRILAVVDAFDAMTNERVYRKAMSPEEAKKELTANAGSQFDPVVIDVFLKILEKRIRQQQ